MASAPGRRPVARGGMFNTPKAKFSKETQELLKVMMEESKLTNFQRRQLKTTLDNGQSLPLRCNPTSSASDNRLARTSSASKAKSRDPSKQGLRSKNAIEEMVKNNDDGSYRPTPTSYDSSKEKAKLQNVMAFGSEEVPRTRQRPPVTEEEEVDRFEEVMREVEERRRFLEDMAALGQDKPHRSRIMTEISQKIRELEEIDRARSLEVTLSNNDPS